MGRPETANLTMGVNLVFKSQQVATIFGRRVGITSMKPAMMLVSLHVLCCYSFAAQAEVSDPWSELSCLITIECDPGRFTSRDFTEINDRDLWSYFTNFEEQITTAPVRGQFEKIEEYEARLGEHEAGSNRQEHRVLPVKGSIDYDPDEEKLLARVDRRELVENFSSNEIRENAFGAKRNVSIYKATFIELNARGDELLKLSLPIDLAKDIFDSLEITFFLSYSRKEINNVYDSKVATIDSLSDREIHSKQIVGDIVGWVISNRETGEIFESGQQGNAVKEKAEEEYLPIVKVQPVYPRRALSRGISGWAIVEFTVTSRGTVKKPSVVENCAHVGASQECVDSPNGVFDSSAMRAAAKFKYEPKRRNGIPVETRGVRDKITYELAL
jgi:TonB family protein